MHDGAEKAAQTDLDHLGKSFSKKKGIKNFAA